MRLNPKGVGPDPNGKRGRNKFRKKAVLQDEKLSGMCSYENYTLMLITNADYNEGKNLGHLMNYLDAVAPFVAIVKSQQ